jgi:O-antigen ligase
MLYFGGRIGRPFGTFANPNHFANYLAMALVAYVWLGSTSTRLSWSRHRPHMAGSQAFSMPPPRTTLWIAGGVLLVLGIVVSRSRGALLAGLPAALCAFAIAVTALARNTRTVRITLAVAVLATLGAVAMVGFDAVFSRFEVRSFAADAALRGQLARTTLEGAWQFWPFGAGWGTFSSVYPRFQPASIVGFANQAHHDYAQLLFEGGIFAVVLMAAFAWLALSRAAQLARAAMRRRRMRSEELLSVLCGLGLLGFLLHSLVEFSMHIPANAIMASLLAGVYLRPLDGEETASD